MNVWKKKNVCYCCWRCACVCLWGWESWREQRRRDEEGTRQAQRWLLCLFLFWFEVDVNLERERGRFQRRGTGTFGKSSLVSFILNTSIYIYLYPQNLPTGVFFLVLILSKPSPPCWSLPPSRTKKPTPSTHFHSAASSSSSYISIDPQKQNPKHTSTWRRTSTAQKTRCLGSWSPLPRSEISLPLGGLVQAGGICSAVVIL